MVKTKPAQNKKKFPGALSQSEIERQTKKSWATRLTTYEEVPPECQKFFEPLQKAGRYFPYCVVTPTYEGFLNRSREMLVCTFDQKIYFLHKNDIPVNVTYFDFKDVCHISFRKVLLESGLQISGTDQEGQNTTIELRFNTVTDYLFTPIINEIRQTQFNGKETKDDFDFSELESVSYKFANFARHSLLPGKKTLQVIWQPELRTGRFQQPIFNFLNKVFTRLIFTNHVTLLTDQELILIREDEHQVRKENYGGVWDFVPLKHIEEFSLDAHSDGLVNLLLTLTGGFSLTSLFEPSQKANLNLMINALKIKKSK